MSTTVRVIKGFTSAVTLPGFDDISTAVLVDGDRRVDLDCGGNVVTITEAQLKPIPVPARPNAVYECAIEINGDAEIPCLVIANPSKPGGAKPVLADPEG